MTIATATSPTSDQTTPTTASNIAIQTILVFGELGERLLVSAITAGPEATTYSWPCEDCGTTSYDGTTLLVAGPSTAALTINNPPDQLSYHSACTFTASATKGECVYEASSGALSTKTTRMMEEEDFSTRQIIITSGIKNLNSPTNPPGTDSSGPLTSDGSASPTNGANPASTGAGAPRETGDVFGAIFGIVGVVAVAF